MSQNLSHLNTICQVSERLVTDHTLDDCLSDFKVKDNFSEVRRKIISLLTEILTPDLACLLYVGCKFNLDYYKKVFFCLGAIKSNTLDITTSL